MYNSISLQEQELIRSIADLIIQDHVRARNIFGDFTQITTLYPELSDICFFVTTFDNDELAFYKNLENEINKIDNKSIRNIFISAFNSYINKNYIYKTNNTLY